MIDRSCKTFCDKPRQHKPDQHRQHRHPHKLHTDNRHRRSHCVYGSADIQHCLFALSVIVDISAVNIQALRAVLCAMLFRTSQRCEELVIMLRQHTQIPRFNHHAIGKLRLFGELVNIITRFPFIIFTHSLIRLIERIRTVNGFAVRIGNEYQYIVVVRQFINLFVDVALIAVSNNAVCYLFGVVYQHCIIKALKKNCLQQPQYRKNNGGKQHKIQPQFCFEGLRSRFQIYIPPL